MNSKLTWCDDTARKLCQNWLGAQLVQKPNILKWKESLKSLALWDKWCQRNNGKTMAAELSIASVLRNRFYSGMANSVAQNEEIYKKFVSLCGFESFWSRKPWQKFSQHIFDRRDTEVIISRLGALEAQRTPIVLWFRPQSMDLLLAA